MKWEKLVLMYIIFVLIGIVCIIISQVVVNEKWLWLTTPLLNIGVTIIASTILFILTNMFLGNPLSTLLSSVKEFHFELRKDILLMLISSNLGLIDIHKRRDEILIDRWVSLIRKAKNRIWLLGVAFNHLYDYHDLVSDLKHFISKGGEFKVFILDPDSPVVSELTKRVQGQFRLKERIEFSLERFIKVLPEESEEYLGKAIWLYEHDPFCTITLVDNLMYVTDYIYNEPAAPSPTYVFLEKEGGLFHTYFQEFINIEKVSMPYSEKKKSKNS